MLLGLTCALALAACGAAPAAPTPNIDATVEARVKELVADQVNNLQPNPDLGMDYLRRALNYGQSGDWQLAIEDFDKAIKLCLNDALAYVGRGVAYDELGQYLRAIEDYDKAIKLDPDFGVAYKSRGLAYRKLGQDAKADADKAKACSSDSQWC